MALDFQVEMSSSSLDRCVEVQKRGKCMAFKTMSLDEVTKGVSVVNKVGQGLGPGTFQYQEKRRNQQRTLTKNDQQGRKTKRVES